MNLINRNLKLNYGNCLFHQNEQTKRAAEKTKNNI